MTPSPTIGVLALQGDVREHRAMLERAGAASVAVRRPEEIDRVDGQETLGGLDVVVRRNAFGRQVDSFEAELTVVGLDSPFHAVFIRAPWVEKVGRDVEVVATVVAGPAAGRIVAVRQANLLATSFHPEVSGDYRIHGLFLDLVSTATRK